MRGSFVPYICVASPLICFVLDKSVQMATGYSFGYELLMLNGLLTFVGLWISGKGLTPNGPTPNGPSPGPSL